MSTKHPELSIPPSPQNGLESANSVDSSADLLDCRTVPGQGTGSALYKPNAVSIMNYLASDHYRPANLQSGKEVFISYYVMHPQKGKRVRKKEMLNYIKDPKERKRYAQLRIKELNLALARGWNPWIEKRLPNSTKSIDDGLDDFLMTKEREQLRKDSMRSYRSFVKLFRKWKNDVGMMHAPMYSLTADHGVAFMDHRFIRDGITPRTFNSNRSFFTTLGIWWRKHGYHSENIFKNVDRKRVQKRVKNRRKFTMEERKLVGDHMKEHDPRFFAFSMIVFYCGLRPKEVFYLRPEHFNLRRQFIQVEAHFSKNGNARRAAIPDVLLPLLEALNTASTDPMNYVFSTDFDPGTVLRNSRYSAKRWRRIREKLGLPKELKHYSLRDTGARQLVRDGVDVNELCGHLDHHSLEQTSQYSVDTFDEGSELVKRRATEF